MMLLMNVVTNQRLPRSANRRDADLFAVAGRHSRRVQFLKFAIPVFALLAGGVFAMATVFRPGAPVVVSTDAVSLSDGRIVMASPKLDGVTKDKRPYKMQAERAFQDIKNDGLIELEKLSALLPFGPVNTATLSAVSGVYDNTNRKLDLNNEILLKTSDGMTAKMKSAKIDIANNHLSTSDPVDITTQNSRITADSLEVSEGGKRLIFDKRVRLTIDPSKMNKDIATKIAN
jgi:lipopolysaccharide export system protein LptC